MTREERLGRAIARQYATPAMPAEDIEQELRIKWLQLVERYGEEAGRTARTAFRRRALSLVSGKAAITGKPLGIPNHGEAMRLVVGDLEYAREAVGAAVGDDLAVKHMDIHAAIERLPRKHREYVVRRFWMGEASNVVPRTIGIANGTWSEKIRPRLAAELAHLEAARG